MGKNVIHILIGLCVATGAYAQGASKLMREGVLAYKKGDYAQAISKYGQAIEKDVDKNLANYNMGSAYYKAGKADSALMYWQSVATNDKDKQLQSKAWHNIGNSFVQQKNFEKAEDAYKRSLKLNPGDEDTRYNLAYSQRRLQQQQQQQQQQQKQNQKQDDKKEEKEEPKQGDNKEDKENLNKEEAERILKAMDNKEKDLHKKKKMEGEPQAPAKDW